MKNKVLFAVLVIVVSLAMFFYFPRYFKSRQESTLIISGRVEADEIVLSPRISGRLTNVLISDGIEVKKGQVVARLDSREMESLIEQLKSRVEGLKARIKAEEQALQYLREKVNKAIAHARQRLKVAKTRYSQAEAKVNRQKSKFERYKNLAEKGVFPEDRLEDINLSFNLAKEELEASKEMLREAEIALEEARVEKKRIAIKLHSLDSMRSELKALMKQLEQSEVQLSYTEVRAPADGVVLRKVAEPGEVIGAGGVIGIMVIPESLYVKTYLPERFLGRVKVGTEAKVITDAYPDRPVTGRVCYISERAEFTPKEVQSKTERVKQVFSTKICFDSKKASTILKKGMPVDVEIDVGR
ncbi:MAG: HlyD family efflux transporter periplasmic adaptor subunit [Nitrospirae bacterium]|nr:MAG: HlyD family efflux transporter periplasmic adaptor subunit [Nitrospirota bacterium]